MISISKNISSIKQLKFEYRFKMNEHDFTKCEETIGLVTWIQLNVFICKSAGTPWFFPITSECKPCQCSNSEKRWCDNYDLP